MVPQHMVHAAFDIQLHAVLAVQHNALIRTGGHDRTGLHFPLLLLHKGVKVLCHAVFVLRHVVERHIHRPLEMGSQQHMAAVDIQCFPLCWLGGAGGEHRADHQHIVRLLRQLRLPHPHRRCFCDLQLLTERVAVEIRQAAAIVQRQRCQHHLVPLPHRQRFPVGIGGKDAADRRTPKCLRLPKRHTVVRAVLVGVNLQPQKVCAAALRQHKAHLTNIRAGRQTSGCRMAIAAPHVGINGHIQRCSAQIGGKIRPIV